MFIDVLGVWHWEGEGAEVGVGGGMFDQRPAVDVACNHDCSFLCERGKKKERKKKKTEQKQGEVVGDLVTWGLDWVTGLDDWTG